MELVARAKYVVKDDFARTESIKKSTNNELKGDFRKTLKASERSELSSNKENPRLDQAEKKSLKEQGLTNDNQDKIQQLEAAIKDEKTALVEKNAKPEEKATENLAVSETQTTETDIAEEKLLNEELDLSTMAELAVLLEQILKVVQTNVANDDKLLEQSTEELSVNGVELSVKELLVQAEDLLSKNGTKLNQEQGSEKRENLKVELPAEFIDKLKSVANDLSKIAENSKDSELFKGNEFSQLFKDLKAEIVKVFSENTESTPMQNTNNKSFLKPLQVDFNHAATFGKLEQETPEVLDKTIFANQKITNTQVLTRESIFAQVNEAISKTPLSAEHSEMVIKLKPEQLGKLELKIEVHNDSVVAKFDVASQMVKQAIESNLADLKNSLKDKGFGEMSFDVNVRKDNEQNSGANSQSKNRRRIEFEVSGDEGSESYIRSLSALVTETTFEHLA